MTKNVRQQLTLFADKNAAKEIEAVRKKFNPKQSKLIGCHVTLCREDEIRNIDKILDNLKILDQRLITIHFDRAKRFDNGKGVLMPSTNDSNEFHQLRKEVLKDLDINTRRREPHLTLMHPRNATCTDKIFDAINKMNLPTYLRFETISLIEQVDGGRWQIIKTFKLKLD